MDYTRMVFDRLSARGAPDAAAREQIYQACRDEVAVAHTDPDARALELEKLEKVIRRQEMQALHEESLTRGKG